MTWYNPRTWGTKAKKRAYQGADANRFTLGWRASNTSADVEVYQSLEKLRARARQLDRDNPWAAGARAVMVDNVIGLPGIQPRSKLRVGGDPSAALDEKTNKRLEAAYWRWAKAKNCDAEGTKTITQIQRLAISTWFQGGEFLIKKVTGYRPYQANGVDLQLLLLEPDFLDHTFNRAATDTENQVIAGVEVNGFGRPVGYHLFKKHPGDIVTGGTRERIMVPASEIIHGHIPLRAGQKRSPPVMHAVMRRLHDLDGYEEAERIAAKVSAAKIGIFYTENGTVGGDDALDPGKVKMDAKAGEFIVAPEGYRIDPWDPQHPNSSYDPFMLAMLRGIAAGTNMSYESVTRDLSRTSFSSSRTALLSERECFKVLQDWFAETVMARVFEWWLDAAHLGVFLSNPIPQYLIDREACLDSVLWRGRSWGWVDPLKEVQALQEELRSGITTLTRVYDERGLDFESEMETAASERKLFKKLGLAFNFAPGLDLEFDQNGEVSGAKKKPQADPAPENVAAADGLGEDAKTAPEISLNGAQVTALIEIITAVAEKRLPRETGVQLISVAFAITIEQADAVMGEVGRTFFVESGEDNAAAKIESEAARCLMRARAVIAMCAPIRTSLYAAKGNGKSHPAWSFDA